jgi:phosphatidylglycerol---prolipoprotein diacylglyceryl transferase
MLPRLFHLGSFNLYTYGTLLAVAIIVGIVLSAYLSERQGLDPRKAHSLGILAALSGIVGAKLLFVFLEWNCDAGHLPETISQAIFHAGGAFLGGLVAALVTAVWYIRKHNLPILRTCDAFAPALAMGHAIGRLGCFAAGCCYGKPSTHFWSVTFTNPLANELAGTPLGKPLEPTQLFESTVEFINFLILWRIIKRKRFDGQVIGTYLLLYGVARFLLEFLRGDAGRGEVFSGLMSGTQLIAIGLVIAGGSLWIRQSTSGNSHLPIDES